MSTIHATSGALWAISYSLERSVEEYLQWFHEVHIPEKLARPGYAWAAHYQSLDAPDRYLALFAAASAQVFLSPTPGQLKGRQDPLTRRMTGLRVGASSSVLLETLSMEGRAQPRPDAGPVARFAQIPLADAAAEDEFCAWAVNERLPQFATRTDVVRATLLVAAIGQPRHALLEHYASREALDPWPRAGRVLEARRIWPAV
jgi:hypothetical protein